MKMKLLTKRVIIILFLAQCAWTQQIAITIDDSPAGNSKLYKAVERGQLLIKELKKAEVKQVVFFSVGKRANTQKGLKLLQMYANAGHLIANHSYHHWAFRKKDTVAYTQDILKAEKVIRQIPTFKKWYRSPQLQEGETREKRDCLRNFLKQHGYIYGYVTVDTYEFYIEYLLQKGLKRKRQFNKENLKKLYLEHMWKAVLFYDGVAQFISQPVKHTLLLHDNDVTVMFIKDLVELLREKGWTIICPEEAYTDTLLSFEPDVLLNNQGRIMAIAKSKGYSGPFRTEDENRQAIEDLFVKYNVWNK